jgi:hypothetical protein
MIAAASSRLESLLRTPADALRALPDSSTEQLDDDGRNFLLSVWHDTIPSGAHRIVVQAYQHRVLGFGFMHAVGFTLSPDGNKQILRDEDLYEFA